MTVKYSNNIIKTFSHRKPKDTLDSKKHYTAIPFNIVLNIFSMILSFNFANCASMSPSLIPLDLKPSPIFQTLEHQPSFH